jgi:hypothetical protein
LVYFDTLDLRDVVTEHSILRLGLLTVLGIDLVPRSATKSSQTAPCGRRKTDTLGPFARFYLDTDTQRKGEVAVIATEIATEPPDTSGYRNEQRTLNTPEISNQSTR